MSAETNSPMLKRVLQLAEALRRSGIEVSTGELIDACHALGHLDLLDRLTLRAGLKAAMVKDAVASERFDALFNATFRATPGAEPSTPPRRDRVPNGGAGAPLVPRGTEGLSDAVLRALMSGDRDELRLLAAQAVEFYGGLDDADGSQRYFLHRVLRAIDLSRMLSAAMQQLRRDGDLTGLELMLQRNELARMLEEFRRQLAAEIAARLRPFDDVEIPTSTDPADRDLLQLAPNELAELRRLVKPLARQLAARVGRRRASLSTGRLDSRRTVRRSLQSGGVPLDVVLKRKHPHRPDVVLLCDVSGSVAEFAQFTFALVNAIHDELSRVRSFAFVDGIAEVSDLFEQALYDVQVRRFVERRGVIRLDGHSDYGSAFAQFEREHLAQVTARTTVIITGDARNNYRDPQPSSLAGIAHRARRVYWLNPEPRSEWTRDDAVLETYRPYLDGAFEVRTLRQLADAIGLLV